MEATKEEIGFLEKIRPPRLEDAGLEDCALPPDLIKEAFLKAATAVSSRVSSVLSSGDADGSEGECVNDPLPAPADEIAGSGSVGEGDVGVCSNEKGGVLIGDGFRGADLVGSGVPDGGEDVVVAPTADGGDGRPCVEGGRGLKVGEKKKEVGEDEGPTLVEGYLV